MVKEDNDLLKELSESLKKMLKGQNRIIKILEDIAEKKDSERKSVKDNESKALDVVTQLSLPDNIRKTALALSKLGEATAEQVARETERTRAIESAYLNQLQRMGYINRRRKGHTVIYFIS